MLIRLYQFNSYYNRQLKKYDSLDDYPYPIYQEDGTDIYFNPGDNVRTSIVCGRQHNEYAGNCNYLIYSADNVSITSRWYIIEQTRNLIGQYTLTLLRDVLADNWTAIKAAPVYIEKATVSDDSPFIYNAENIEVNQIKQNETLLKDSTGCAWLCGFIAKNYAGGTVSIETDIYPDITLSTTIDQWEHYNLVGHNYKLNSREFYIKNFASAAGCIKTSSSAGEFVQTTIPSDITIPDNISTTLANAQSAITRLNNFSALYSDVMTLGASYDQTSYSSEIDTIRALKGKFIKDSTNKIYKIGVHLTRSNIITSVSSDVSGVYIDTVLRNVLSPLTVQTYCGSYVSDVTDYQLTLTEQYTATASLEIPAEGSRTTLKDAPMDMFCIPYPADTDTVSVKLSASETVSITKVQAMNIAQAIASTLGSNIYDIELLPYCPISIDNVSGVLDASAFAEERVTPVEVSDNPIACIFWSASSSGSKNITKSISYDNKKMDNQTKLYRISAGSYTSSFDLNIAKNNGIASFNVDYTYLPYGSYIHVNPDFGGLYGQDFNDTRGLIDQGNKSITTVTDQWKEYQVNNSTYQQVFNRTIDNLETNRDIARGQQIANSLLSIGGGALMGGINGDPYKAIAGAATGALSAGINYVASEASYAETIDYKKDLFNLSLKNIQALPNTVSKITTYTENNKIFPVLELYDCTAVEKRAVANKIRYNGMTVNAVGTINDYINNSWNYDGIADKGYIKGQLIQLDLNDDYHMIAQIYDELNKGVYTK